MSDASHVVTEQAPPVPSDRPATWGVVIARLTAARCRICDDDGAMLPAPAHDSLLSLMAERDAEGWRKYGVPLQPFNGRDSVVDLLQEMLDACVYAENAFIESGADEMGRDLILRQIADDACRLALRVERYRLDRTSATASSEVQMRTISTTPGPSPDVAPGAAHSS
jgi:hypothetical protein